MASSTPDSPVPFALHPEHHPEARLIGVAKVQEVVVLEAGVLYDGLIVEALAQAGDFAGVQLVALVGVNPPPCQQVCICAVLGERTGEPGAELLTVVRIADSGQWSGLTLMTGHIRLAGTRSLLLSEFGGMCSRWIVD